MIPLPLTKLRVPRRRKVSDWHVSQMVAEFKKDGQLRPILVDCRFNIVDGIARFLAAKELGWERIYTDKITNGPVIAKSTVQRGRRVSTAVRHLS